MKSSDRPSWATLPKLSQSKLLSNVVPKMLASESLSKLPPYEQRPAGGGPSSRWAHNAIVAAQLCGP